MRCFVALPLDSVARDSVTPIIHHIDTLSEKGVTVVQPQNLHITLAFIGEIDQNRTVEVISSLTAITFPPICVTLTGTGRFPAQTKSPRVLWIGIEVDDHCHQLSASIISTLTKTGLHFEKRPFSPHLTIARCRYPIADKLDILMNENKSILFHQFITNEFVLYKSFRGPDGIQYEPIQRFPLSA